MQEDKGKIILFTGGVETLTYFSKQLAAYFEQQGYAVFFYDLKDPSSAKRVKRFIKPKKTVLFTFNFLGLSGEEGAYEEGRGYLWEQYDIPCYNMLVDHPLYYVDRFEQLPKDSHLIAIDRDHEQFLRRYYGEYDILGFCPLAGTSLFTDGMEQTKEEWVSNRSLPVLFVGNYNDYRQYESYITRINDEYTAFYRGIISELLHHPEKTLTEVARRHCVREMGELSTKGWRICYQNLNFIDLYIRFYEREQVLRAFVEAGIEVHVYGNGYETFEKVSSPFLHIHGGTDSYGCLTKMQQAKISLNVMPWFRDGAHDRVFNAMANGSVSMTDDSRYLREILTDGRHLVYYDVAHPEAAAKEAKSLLQQTDKLYEIARNGYEIATGKHLFCHRAKWLLSQMFS